MSARGRVGSPAISPPESPQSQAQVSPAYMGSTQHEHSFTLQAVMEMRESVGQMNANLVALTKSVDSLKSDVKDLVNWKQRIVGGAVVLGAIGTLLGFALAKGSEFLTFKAPTASVQSTVPVPQLSASGAGK